LQLVLELQMIKLRVGGDDKAADDDDVEVCSTGS
jgi:hypothetical protein